MEVKPVKQNEKPGYPLKTEFRKEELKKQIPKRWIQSQAAKVALGTLAVVTLAGCAPEILAGVEEAVTPPTEASLSATPGYIPEDTYVPEGTAAPAMINVAPLFIHGDGRGTYGCDMVASPSFISEYEAMTVINEVAQEYGLEFTSESTPEFYNVLQPASDPNTEPIQNAQITKMPDKIINLKSDFADNEHGIAIEFVSTGDVTEWRQWPVAATVEVYDTKDAAAQLSESLENARADGYYTIAVMYDPCAVVEPEDMSDQKNWEEAAVKSREIAEEQLKKQARDFFEWLKSQGVL